MLLLRFVLLFIAVASVFPAASSSSECNKTELLAILKPLKSNANYASFSTIHVPCFDTACKALIAPTAALNLPNCTVTTVAGTYRYNPHTLKRLTIAQCQTGSMYNDAFTTYWNVLRLVKD